MEAYVAYCIDNKILDESSSGGIFTLISNCIIDKGGVVYGASFNDKLEVVHTRVDKKEDLYKLRGSKYVQSLLRDSYKNTLQDLENDKYVLYTGTPCQIAGLKEFLKKDYEKLYTQDIICHGVPITKVWNMYKFYLNKKYNSELKKISFRDKSKGWQSYLIKLDFENGKIVKERFQDNLYMKAFLNNLILRKSCYNCKYKNKERMSDITLADFWGVTNVCPEMYNESGTSLVIIYSRKGQELLDTIKKEIRFKCIDLDEAIKYNPAMIKSVDYNKYKDNFLEELKKNDFKKTVNKFIPKKMNNTVFKRIPGKIIRVFRRLK